MSEANEVYAAGLKLLGLSVPEAYSIVDRVAIAIGGKIAPALSGGESITLADVTSIRP